MKRFGLILTVVACNWTIEVKHNWDPGHLSAKQCSSYTDLWSAHYCLIQNDLEHARPKTYWSRAAHRWTKKLLGKRQNTSLASYYCECCSAHSVDTYCTSPHSIKRQRILVYVLYVHIYTIYIYIYTYYMYSISICIAHLYLAVKNYHMPLWLQVSTNVKSMRSAPERWLSDIEPQTYFAVSENGVYIYIYIPWWLIYT